MTGVSLMRADDLKLKTTQTQGMERQEAFSNSSMWSGYVHTEPGMISGWHHHGDYDTVIYVIAGKVKMEWGANGRESVDAKAGDFLFVPKSTIHRESNSGKDESAVIVVRVGSGQPVVNVEGPP